jgi:hypothetical protein
LKLCSTGTGTRTGNFLEVPERRLEKAKNQERESPREGKTQESQDAETRGNPTPESQPTEGSNP